MRANKRQKHLCNYFFQFNLSGSSGSILLLFYNCNFTVHYDETKNIQIWYWDKEQKILIRNIYLEKGCPIMYSLKPIETKN